MGEDRASQMALVVKSPPANAGNIKDLGLSPRVGKIPWRRAWQPTPVFMPGKSQGQRSLEGYSLWGHKESDMTERLTPSLFIELKTFALQKTLCRE